MSKAKAVLWMILVCVAAVCGAGGGGQESLPTAVISVDAGRSKPISPLLFGIFFEDINYAADGGLYAELVQNRSFEYSRGDNRSWNALTAWQLLQSSPEAASVSVSTDAPLHPNNPHYAVLTLRQAGQGNGLRNSGFDGMVVKGGDKYDVSLFARVVSGSPAPITVRLESPDGAVLGQAQWTDLNAVWTKHTAVIEAAADASQAHLTVYAGGTGALALDMISLFPQKTFKNRPNGLRPDLAQVIADLKPKFVRFPGGCVAHGDGLENMYRWKDTIGPVEQRKSQRNIWRYHQSLGLGYFEYFQFCEDIGAEPLPVVPAGVCCQNSGNYLNLVPRGQQGIPMDQMDAYVQEVLDLIEWANGPASSEWGAKRAAAGHPEPFNLKYLGVGNEDAITPVFKERFKMIHDAVKARYPDIVVIGTSGPFTDGRDFDEGWQFAREEKLAMVDEHGYKSPGWFWDNLQRYDAYPRSGPKVYLGEYAAHDEGRLNTLRSALAEAAYMTSLERNGDVAAMASYAPLLSKEGRTQWRPDLIYFDNVSITPSINYYVQQLFSVNQGDAYLPTTVNTAAVRPTEKSAAGPSGILLGTWNTQAQFDNVKVVCGPTVVLEEAFDKPASGWKTLSGRWTQADGVYRQTAPDTPALSMYACSGDNCTITLRAMKTGGAEGFLIGFGAKDAHNYYWWNLGGWNNTSHAVEKITDGGKSTVGRSAAGRIEANRWYDIRIQMADNRIQCYLDGELIHDLTDRGFVPTPDLAASAVREAKTGDVIIKIVSKADKAMPAEIDLSTLGRFRAQAVRTVLTGKPEAVNRFGQTPEVLPQVWPMDVSEKFAYEIPPCSLTVIRVKMPR
ncbi:MAG: carbohydrate binding domain-containing protein [Phycisphaerae bacterium]|nr:carbohydrate binding domain-containing protein [Phycisphaerae bacterium]